MSTCRTARVMTALRGARLARYPVTVMVILLEIRGGVGVDEQVVMPGVLELDPRGRDTHPLEAELHPYRALHRGAVLGRDDVGLGARRGGGTRQSGGARRRGRRLSGGERGGENQGGNEQRTHG